MKKRVHYSKEIHDQPGAGGQPSGLEPVRAQPLLEEGRRLELGERELGVGVQVAARRHHLRMVARDPVVDGRSQLLDDRVHAACPPAQSAGPGTGPGGRPAGPLAGRPSRSSASRLSTTGFRSPPDSAATARCRW